MKEQEQWQAGEKGPGKRNRTIGILIAVIVIIGASVLYLKAIKPSQTYGAGLAAMQDGRYDEATEIFTALGDYRDAAVQARESQYQKAAAANAAGAYDAAYRIYASLADYKDAERIIKEDGNIAAAAALARFDVGNTVTFGACEQDNNPENGAEAIEWLVLENDGKTAKLISKYIIDCIQFNELWLETTWETCSLRQWLNSEFVNAAFSDEEQARLEMVTVTARKNQDYNTDPGNDTEDRVFLLNIQEANKLLPSGADRACQATAYAKAHGIIVVRDQNSWWWLRSPGASAKGLAIVTEDGSINASGIASPSDNTGIRPVIVVRIP